MKCLLYARVSTERQAEKDLSLPAQLQAMREHAQRQGWTVVEEFIEAGASGRTADRPALKRLLSRCREEPKADVVLVHKIDRLARNVYDHATIKAFLNQRSVRLTSVVENLDDSISGQLVENIMASLAAFYSANLGEESRKGMKALVERGGWPHKPARGYRMVRDEHGRGAVVPDDTSGPQIRWVFERYATGFTSLKRLRLDAAAKGLLGATGKPLAVSYLRQLLENPFYIGRIRWKGREYPGRHKALVDEALFERVQKVLASRFRDTGEKSKYRFLLRGIACCSECGSKMTAERHGDWSYYRCIRHTVSKALCSARFSNVDVAHAAVVSLYGQLRVPSDLRSLILTEARTIILGRLATARQDTNSARMQLVRLEEREVRCGEAFASGDMTPEVYRALTQKTRVERAALQNILQRADDNPKILLEKVQKVLDAVESLRDLHLRLQSDESRRNLTRVVFRRINLAQGRIREYVLNPPFDRLLREDDAVPNLEPTAVTAAIKTILEFDLAGFENVLECGEAA